MEPRKSVHNWQRFELTDVTAKVVIYEAFVEGKLEAPIHLVRNVLDLYFDPKYEEFRARTIWSLSNAFTSRFKQLEPIPQFKATAIRSVAEYSGDPPQRFPTSGFPVRYAFPLSVLPHNRQIDWETVV